MAALLCGCAFGAAIAGAGLHHPTTLFSQLRLENWHVSQVFLTATASSAAIYTILKRLGYVKIPPRSSSPLGLFSSYDGNVLGGALLGVGMALSRAWPETLLVQSAAGIRAGSYALVGAVLGGIVWTGFISKPIKAHKEQHGVRAETAMLQEQLGMSEPATLVGLEIISLATVAATSAWTQPSPHAAVSGATGGLLIGLAQGLSLVTRRSMMGVSGSYEEMGSLFWWACNASGSRPALSTLPHNNILFAAGVYSGAWGLSGAVPSLIRPAIFEIPPIFAVAGGALMVIGSRMAGGCTSGHGISGISLLSTASVVTMLSAFSASGLVAPLLH